MANMTARTGALDDARRKKIRDLVEKYISKMTAGDKGNGAVKRP